jgi:exosome complex RNA-binding protein Csl4
VVVEGGGTVVDGADVVDARTGAVVVGEVTEVAGVGEVAEVAEGAEVAGTVTGAGLDVVGVAACGVVDPHEAATSAAAASVPVLRAARRLRPTRRATRIGGTLAWRTENSSDSRKRKDVAVW